MTKRWAAAAALGTLALLAGCAGGPSTDATASASAARQAFLLSADKVLPHATDADATMAAGKAVCSAYDAGTTFADEVAYLETTLVSVNGNYAINAKDAGYFIGTSTSAFCPKYNDRH